MVTETRSCETYNTNWMARNTLNRDIATKKIKTIIIQENTVIDYLAENREKRSELIAN